MMTKQDIFDGFDKDNHPALVQEEWAAASEILAVEELIAEGKVWATDWVYKDGFQCCARIIRPQVKTHVEARK
jgi:hypothetical protein